MKKLVLSALLFAAATASAHAQYMSPKTGPTNAYYSCTYYNTNLHELDGADGGLSRFDIAPVTPEYLQGSEVFIATYGPDRRKVTFAKPVNLYSPVNGAWRGTRWEFTINPGGPQCRNTIVRDFGSTISFQDCTDGSSRFCTLL